MLEFETDLGVLRVTQDEQYGDIEIACGDKSAIIDAESFSNVCRIFLDLAKN